MKNKTLFFISLSVATYLSLLFLNGYVFKLTYTILGVLQEMLTIPTLLLLLALVGITVARISKTGVSADRYLVSSALLLSLSVVGIIGSFVFL